MSSQSQKQISLRIQMFPAGQFDLQGGSKDTQRIGISEVAGGGIWRYHLPSRACPPPPGTDTGHREQGVRPRTSASPHSHVLKLHSIFETPCQALSLLSGSAHHSSHHLSAVLLSIHLIYKMAPVTPLSTLEHCFNSSPVKLPSDRLSSQSSFYQPLPFLTWCHLQIFLSLILGSDLASSCILTLSFETH